MKLVVLKPIMWNTKNWVHPSGYPSASGYTHKHGFGHEEWNNNAKWIWNGRRYFHTEATERLLEFAHNSNLGMIMIASHAGEQFALGVAVSVSDNKDDDMPIIADELGVHALADEVWSVERVRKCFRGDRPRFQVHWDDQYKWIRWQCEEDDYLWFKQPLLLNPKNISGKSRLLNMHGKFQPISPAVALAILKEVTTRPSTRILDWFRSGQFDQRLTPKTPKGIKPARNRQPKTSSNRPTDHPFEYWVMGNRKVEPRHDPLQAAFMKHLRAHGFEPDPNNRYVDVRYQRRGKTVLCEIKPTDTVPPRFAARIAIGQLLEYRHRQYKSAMLEIVLGSEPDAATKDFVKSLGMWLTYRTSHGSSFKTLSP